MADEQVVSQGAAEQVSAIDAAGQAGVVAETSRAQQTPSEIERAAEGQKTSVLSGEKPAESAGDKAADKPDDKADDKAGEKDPERGAPEEYGDFAVPEGVKMEGQDLTEFKSFAKEQDLTQEQAQKVLDYAGPKIKAMIEQPYKTWNETQTKWQAEVKADPEIGGTNFERSVKEAGSVFVPGEANPFVKSEADAKALRDALNTTGAGNNPAIVKLFVKMGKLLSEPGHLAGKPAGQNKQDALLNSMYPTMGEGRE